MLDTSHWEELDVATRLRLRNRVIALIRRDPTVRAIGRFYLLFAPFFVVWFVEFAASGVSELIVYVTDAAPPPLVSWLLKYSLVIGWSGGMVTRLLQMRREIAICHSLSIPYIGILRIR